MESLPDKRSTEHIVLPQGLTAIFTIINHPPLLAGKILMPEFHQLTINWLAKNPVSQLSDNEQCCPDRTPVSYRETVNYHP
jgi:hypothetical protein